MRRFLSILGCLALCSCFSRVAAFAALLERAAEHACCQPDSAPSMAECCPEAAAHAPTATAASPTAVPKPGPLSEPVAVAARASERPAPRLMLSAVPARAPPRG